MDLRQEEGHEILEFLQDPSVYRLNFLHYERHRRSGTKAIKRKYSVEMRQKATIREKNRIRSIGREFSKLANLLPDSNGTKRSHQKILHDTVAYIRALEAELKLIDDKTVFKQWSISNESWLNQITIENADINFSAERNYVKDSNGHMKRDKKVEKTKISHSYMNPVYDIMCYKDNETNNDEQDGHKTAREDLKQSPMRNCPESLRKVEKTKTDVRVCEGQVKFEMNDEDFGNREINGDDETEMQESEYGNYDEKKIDESFHLKEDKGEHLSFGNVVIGLNFNL